MGPGDIGVRPQVTMEAFRPGLDAMRAPAAIVGVDGLVALVNRACIEVGGFDHADQVEGRQFIEFIAPEGRFDAMTRFEQAASRIGMIDESIDAAALRKPPRNPVPIAFVDGDDRLISESFVTGLPLSVAGEPALLVLFDAPPEISDNSRVTQPAERPLDNAPVPLLVLDMADAAKVAEGFSAIPFAEWPEDKRTDFAHGLRPVAANRFVLELFDDVPESVLLEHMSAQLVLSAMDTELQTFCTAASHMITMGLADSNFEWICTGPSGDSRDVRVMLAKEETAEGMRFLCSLVDITAQRRAEYEAQTYRRQLEDLFQSRGSQVETALEDMWNGMDIVSKIVESRDRFTAGHMKRVSRLATKIAETLGLERDLIDDIRLAAALHDLGKIGIPAEILNKQAELTAAERALLQDHVTLGTSLLESAGMKPQVVEIVAQHHEREDGSGYPSRLRRDVICSGAKVLAVADTVESMCADRPHRKAAGVNAAVDELISGKGRLYEPRIVDALLQLLAEDFSFDFDG